MTAVAWAIIFYVVTTNPAPNLPSGGVALMTFSFFAIVVLTIRDLFR